MGEPEESQQDVSSVAASVDDQPASEVARELLDRCNNLLNELEQFGKLLEDKKKPPVLGHRGLIQDINAEKRFIERLLGKRAAEEGTDEDTLEADGRIKHQLSSTNLGSYEAVWAAVKQCHGLVALRQTFWRNPKIPKPSHRGLSPSSKVAAHRKKTQDGVLVDAVIDNGAEWLKVSAISERQLLFQMARQGWRNESDSDEDEDEDFGRPKHADDDDSDDEDEISIIKMARALCAASKANRHAYRHPRLRFVLPKISTGKIKEVDTLLQRIRDMGITLLCANDTTSPPTAAPSLTTALTHLLTNPHRTFTPTLNIDCTLLVALASDISHSRVAAQPWFPGAVKAQIRDEAAQALMPGTLYPALGGRTLVCTEEAARRMREIVATIGTEAEVARAAILMGDVEPERGAEKEGQELRRELQRWSIHRVPAELQLPIRVVSRDVEGAVLPDVAAAVEPHLTDINRSIFLYGWAAGCTTLSSNGTVAKQIEALIEQNRTRDDEVGPDVWVCPVARSLVAKKGRRQE